MLSSVQRIPLKSPNVDWFTAIRSDSEGEGEGSRNEFIETFYYPRLIEEGIVEHSNDSAAQQAAEKTKTRGKNRREKLLMSEETAIQRL